MCYALPGPRCSSHAFKAVIRARKAGDEEALREAQKEYALTPQGIAELRAKGRDEAADKALALREARLAALTEQMETKTLVESLHARMKADEFHELRRLRTEAEQTHERLREEADILKQDPNVDFEDLRTKIAESKSAYYDMLVARQNLDMYKDETAHLVARISDRSEDEEYEATAFGKVIRMNEYPSNSREWLIQRQGGIGGSDVGAILKLDKDYATSNYDRILDSKLIDYKSMDDSEFVVTEENESRAIRGAMQRGDAWESSIARMFADKNPEFKLLHSKATWQDPDEPWKRANFDGLLSSTGDEPDGILEIKTAANPDKWADGVPAGYRAQVLWYLETTGLDYGYVAVQIDDNEYRQYRIERGEAITPEVGTVQDVLPKIQEFRERVDAIKAGAPRKAKRNPHPAITKRNQTAAVQTIAAYGSRSEEDVQASIDARVANGEKLTDAVRNEMQATPLKGEKVYLDIEATGISPTTNDIIEVGWTRRNEANEVVDEGNMMFSPDERLLRTRGTGPVDVHGITPDDVAGAPHFSEPESQKRLQEAFSGATLVVHNARYENSFLGQELNGYHAAKHTVLDTMNVSKFFGTGEDNTLRSFSESNGVEYKNAHRALQDSNMTADALFQFSKRGA